MSTTITNTTNTLRTLIEEQPAPAAAEQNAAVSQGEDLRTTVAKQESRVEMALCCIQIGDNW
jgi:hypothetical protein